MLPDAVQSEIALRAREFGIACECESNSATSPPEGNVRFAHDKKCDLIVMGTRGRARVSRFVFGSAAASGLKGLSAFLFALSRFFLLSCHRAYTSVRLCIVRATAGPHDNLANSGELCTSVFGSRGADADTSVHLESKDHEEKPY